MLHSHNVQCIASKSINNRRITKGHDFKSKDIWSEFCFMHIHTVLKAANKPHPPRTVEIYNSDL